MIFSFHLSQAYLVSGSYSLALEAAENVLKLVTDIAWIRLTRQSAQEPRNLNALVAKAECLYTSCHFEHALMLFTRYSFMVGFVLVWFRQRCKNFQMLSVLIIASCAYFFGFERAKKVPAHCYF